MVSNHMAQERNDRERIARQSRQGSMVWWLKGARAANQVSPLPGTEWEDSDGGCGLVVVDQRRYFRFLWGGRP